VGKNQTTLRERSAVALLLFAHAACGLGADPDPRVIAARLDASRGPARQAFDGPVPVVAELTIEPPPAPLAEASLRQDLPERRATPVAVGRNAVHAIDSEVQRAFAAAQPGLENGFVAAGDREALELLLVGRADFGVVGAQLSMREQQAGLRQTRLGVELFALVVSPDVAVRSLSSLQVRQVLTGEVTHWQQLGYAGGAIVVVVPADRDLADRAARVLMPGDAFASSAVGVASERHVVDQLLQNPGAVAVVRLLDQPMESGQKLLQIDWCAPTADAFDYGTYPYGLAVHLVTAGPPAGPGQQFLDFARSEAGRALLRRTLLVR
jgi:phosphate transport system substrate-binding protein